eukprot:scaffold103504_cov55-Attheya_sp.AAC.2
MSEEDISSEESSVSVDVPQVVEPVKPNEPEGSSYPLDVPSPLLLASSMVLAIGATGEFSPQDVQQLKRARLRQRKMMQSSPGEIARVAIMA